jgi:hypothetical protein
MLGLLIQARSRWSTVTHLINCWHLQILRQNLYRCCCNATACRELQGSEGAHALLEAAAAWHGNHGAKQSLLTNRDVLGTQRELSMKQAWYLI